MKGLLLAAIAGATLLFVAPSVSEARPWRYYGWGPRPYYRSYYRPYYRPYRVYPYAAVPYRAYRPIYRPYVYGPGYYYGGPGVSVEVW